MVGDASPLDCSTLLATIVIALEVLGLPACSSAVVGRSDVDLVRVGEVGLDKACDETLLVSSG